MNLTWLECASQSKFRRIWGFPRFDRCDALPMWLPPAICVCAALPRVFAIFYGMFSHEVIHVQLLPSQQNASKWIVEDFPSFYTDGLAGFWCGLESGLGFLGWFGGLQNGWISTRPVNQSKCHSHPVYAHQLLELLSIVVSSSVAQTSVTAKEWWWLQLIPVAFIHCRHSKKEKPCLGIPPLHGPNKRCKRDQTDWASSIGSMLMIHIISAYWLWSMVFHDPKWPPGLDPSTNLSMSPISGRGKRKTPAMPLSFWRWIVGGLKKNIQHPTNNTFHILMAARSETAEL